MKKILIVDDQEEIRELLEVTLKSAGFRFLFYAEDGEMAIDIAKKEKPDLILMDAMLPGQIDGFEATRILKQDPCFKRSLIIMLTAKAQKIDIERGYTVGADDYFPKPFSPRDLARRVENMLTA